jgi:hypothetical protein
MYERRHIISIDWGTWGREGGLQKKKSKQRESRLVVE